MSTIKSSDEHLTLNADGVSKDIKFQANGVEKASISSSGAFTSTTIDATKLTGTIPNFTSTGIDDNADATAITIDSNEKVGIATTTPNGLLTIGGAGAIGTQTEPAIQIARSSGNANSYRFGVYTTAEGAVIENKNGDDGIAFNVKTTGQTFQLTTDGRGLSQFTAKVWAYVDGTGTLELKDGHNVSSLTDNGTGDYTINFSNNLANTYYCPTTANSAEAQWGEMLAPGTRAVGSMRFTNTDEGGTNYDSSRMWVTIFGD